MSEEMASSTKRVQQLHDWVSSGVDSLTQELSEVGISLSTQQVDSFRTHRAQRIVDCAASVLTRKQLEESEQELNDELWLANYFEETLPNSNDDWLGLEHVRYILTQMGHEQSMYAASIFGYLVRLHNRETAARKGLFSSDPPALGTQYRFKEDDPAKAKILGKNRLVTIPTKAKWESGKRDGYDGAYLFRSGDVCTTFASGSLYVGGQKTQEAFEALCSWINERTRITDTD